MSTRLLNLGPCTCSVVAPEPVHEAMRHYVSPFLVPTLDGEPDITVSISCDSAAVADARRSLADQPATALRTSHPDQRYRAWITEGHEVLLPEYAPDHVITATPDLLVIAAEQPRVAASIGTRVVRQLLMRGGEIQAGRCVHAAAVDIDGHGVLIGGHPGSGKTTVLTHLIEDHGAHPVANDRAVLIPRRGRQWHAIGVPLAWRFTPEGIGGSPTLANALTDFEPVRGRHLVDGKIELTPWEVSRLVGRPTLPITEIQRIVILTRSPSTPVMNPDSGFVQQHLDFSVEDFFAEDWLNLRPLLARNAEVSARDSEFWLRLAETMPVLALAWTDPSELPDVAAAAYHGTQR
ncbi:hypothetical protein GCM10011581_05640 [Saccharopolyspora subtropica]|uniref:Uncharacterized protein n=1 Tax=Saccharopolyspora thermophila TaxID=89367 RepID=A0A917N6P8_9PSEU|nr:hypothetical protein [Saccharopolyspora subtropica]GGI71454.1 hypothetical protein GCM10011581_05640 [Saccharopolyspora subtropica]